MAYKPAFNAQIAILDTFFYAYNAVVDSFTKVSFFLEKNYTLQYNR